MSTSPLQSPLRFRTRRTRVAASRGSLLLAATCLLLPTAVLLPSPATAAAPPFSVSAGDQALTAFVGETAISETVITANERMLFRFTTSIPTSPGFIVTPSGSCEPDSVTLMQPGDTCLLTATLSPTTALPSSFTSITFEGTAATEAGEPVTPDEWTPHQTAYNYHGNGIEVTPVDFGDVPIGESLTKTVTFTNSRADGRLAIDLKFALPLSPEFTLAPGTETYFELAPGDSGSADVTFTPPAVAAYTGSFVPIFTTMNAVAMVQDPYRVLSGAGVEPTVDPETANLGATDPASLTVTAGADAAFHSTATSDTGVNAVQWETRASEADAWAPAEVGTAVSGASANDASLAIPSAPASLSGLQVRAVWTNDAYGETHATAPATLTVQQPAVVDPGGDGPEQPLPTTPAKPHTHLATSGAEPSSLSTLTLAAAALLLAGSVALALPRIIRARRP